MRRVSKTRQAERTARAKCVATVIARDHVCQWPAMQTVYLLSNPTEAKHFDKVPKCSRDLTAHEPKHSRNVGRLNPEESICSCYVHNSFCESSDGRRLAELIGFIVRGNGEPIRKGVSA